jgi:hypothetical protein
MACVEVATYRPAGDDTELLAADAALQEVAHRQPGLARRTTARGEGGWVTITLWATEADAAAGGVALDVSPAGQRWAALVEGRSVSRYATLD